MTNAQLFVAIAVPIAFNAIGFFLLRASITDLRDSLTARLEDLAARLDSRINDMHKRIDDLRGSSSVRR